MSGVNESAVTAWLLERLPTAEPPFEFTLIAGGNSNLTYRVSDSAGASWVLRRPPLGPLLPTAHDMAREHRIISALGRTRVPVPSAVALCDDVNVNGAPFYVMQMVEGTVFRDESATAGVPPPDRRRLGLALVDVLTDIHAVKPSDVKLDDLGRPDGYIERQLRRWSSQLERSQTRDLPAVTGVHAVLAANIPDQVGSSLVHGDYRLDNCIIDNNYDVRAVLDWELCTLGDPLADLGLLLVYWTQPDDEIRALTDAPTAVGGFPTRGEVIDRYATRSNRPVDQIDFYVAFAYWRLACITEGVHARYRSGAMAGRTDEAEKFRSQVDQLAREAERFAARI
jgi:aminoglycoside phosphotransferase (APT) family kinase protein